MKKLLLLLLIVMAVPVTMMADDPVEIDGIYYNLITKAKIANVTSNPNKYIGDLIIPATVTYNGVAYDVKEIESSAFANSTGLTSIEIPNSVTSIATDAFSGCTGLSSMIVALGNPVYDSRDNCNAIIETSSNSLIRGCTNTTIPFSVTSIGDNAFYGCYDLTSIDIPDGITSIGRNAFRDCSNLTSIDIPESVTSIGSNAFRDCHNLISVDIRGNVISINDDCFRYCMSLTTINLSNSVMTIGTRAFLGCSNLTTITIPDALTTIGGSAFKDCSSLTSITIPENVYEIGTYAFYNCQGLESLRLLCSGSVRSGYHVFGGCSPKLFEINCNLSDNDAWSLFSTSNIETFIVGDELTYLRKLSINDNIYLKNVTLGASYTNVSFIFNNCENLDVVTCHATTPPAASSSFNGSYIEYATLIVPDEAYNAYSTTEPWSNFGTILKASQISTVTAKDYTREYGDANPDEWEYTVVGQALNGEPLRTCAADVTSAPGTYPIVISQGTVTNEHVTYVNGTLTITKAPLTITANSYTIKEGEALPSYDAVFTGLKNSESKSVVSPVVSCTATDSNTPGTYPITVTASSDNYDITTVAGTLTILPAKMSITIGAPGVGTYCSPYDLDFSTVTDFKAYIATGYNSATGNVIVQAVKDVPAGTGLFLKGTPGTYDVPCGESSSYYVNMLVGVTEATTISATDGNMTNFLLSATNTSDACFRPISSTYNLKANRAYLQIPTYMVGSSAGANAVGIEFEDGVTGIDNSLSDMDTDAHWFTLDGRKLNGKPTQKGIYVVNGQKVVIK